MKDVYMFTSNKVSDGPYTTRPEPPTEPYVTSVDSVTDPKHP